MCGRYVSASPPDQIAAYFGATLSEAALPASYNVAPTDDVYAVVDAPNGRHLDIFRWGLIPGWAKDARIGQKLINSRAETIAEKPAFRSIFAKYRCIIPADGFYEWTTDTSRRDAKGKPVKQPHYIRRLDGEPLALAGLWSRWRDPAVLPATSDRLFSASIITTTANATIAALHNRMPVILSASRWAEWLAPATDPSTLGQLLIPAPEGLLIIDAVSTDVNSVRNNNDDLIRPISI